MFQLPLLINAEIVATTKRELVVFFSDYRFSYIGMIFLHYKPRIRLGSSLIYLLLNSKTLVS